MFPKTVFAEVGAFDERLTRNQDNEFNARLIRNGRKIAFDPEIRITYRNQGTLKGLLRQAFHTGMWNVFTCALHPYVFRARHFVPGAFAVYLCVLPFIGPFPASYRMIACVPIVVYVGIVAKASSSGSATLGIVVRTAVTFFLYHVVYGLGTLAGILLFATGRWRARLGKPLVSNPPKFMASSRG